MQNHLPLLLVLGSLGASAIAQTPQNGSDWQRIAALAPHTRVHIKADHASSTCAIQKVDDDTVTCTGSMGGAHTFQRTEIKTVKVTRYGVSTAGGVGIGAGAGLLTGVAAAHGGSDQFKIISNKAIWGVFAAIGGVAGGLVGGPTDFLRGPTVYRRP